MPESAGQRVVFVLNRLDRGGMEQMLLTLSRSLLARGRYQPVIACLADAGELADEARADGIELHARLLRCKFDLFAISRLRRLFAGAAAVVVVNAGGDRMFWSALARGRRGRRPPMLLWLHHTPQPGRRVIEPVNRLLVKRFDTFIALGPHGRAAWTSIEHLPADRMHVVPNGLPTDQVARLAAGQSRAAVREELGLADDDIAVLCVANARPIKRVDLFCRAAARLLAPGEYTGGSRASLRFLLVGDAAGANREGLLTTIRQLGLAEPAFRWLGPRNDIDRLWQGVDIGVCCSDSEAMSVTMLEAMAAGTAFISTDVGEHAAVIEAGQTGLLIPPGSADALAGAIAALAGDPALRDRLSAAARQRVTEHFTAHTMTEAFTSILDASHR